MIYRDGSGRIYTGDLVPGDREATPAEAAAWEAARAAAAVAAALAAIDHAAEQARLAWMTGGAGQALVYSRKAAEAAAIVIAPDADLAGEAAARTRWPLVAAAVGVTVPSSGAWLADLRAAAAQVQAAETTWLAAAAAIETVRLRAKEAVRTAPDQAAFDAILAGLQWPAPPAAA